MHGGPSLSERIRERALELGFARAGVMPVGPVPHGAHLDNWLNDGFDGELAYMGRHAALRRDTRAIEPWARSVVVVSAAYDASPVDTATGRWARYALSDDYHDVVRARLVALSAFIRAEAGAERVARATVDSAPVLERGVAVQAGTGWLAKSAMVIDQHTGPYTFLGELFVDVDLSPAASAHPDRCGTCTRCIDACPTGAIVSPYRVDARRCIAYLTIELKGAIPRALRPAVGDHMFGCDVCMDVCPWSMRRPAPLPGLERRADVAVGAAEALALDAPAFRARFAGTAVERTKRRGLARNAAVVLGNSSDRRWVPALKQAVEMHDEPLVRGHAAWALGRLGGPGARATLDDAHARECDAYVVDELRAALGACT